MDKKALIAQALASRKPTHPSAGMSKKKKSAVVEEAQSGTDMGDKGKNFDKIADKAGGGEKGKRIAGAVFWKKMKGAK